MTVLAVLGPTASGKSALALEVARCRGDERPTEIVAIDAFTVYRGMDLGTAKVSTAERDEVPHHLVDVLDPSEELTVATFRELAREVIADVHARGATPLLVGGSGLYWRAVVDDLRFPPTDAEVRAAIAARFHDDPAGAHAELAGRDPDAAAAIPVENLRRVVRALEVVELTDEPFSAYDRSWDDYTSRYDDLQVAYLEPDTEVLRDHIRRRAERMVADGLIDEAAALRQGDRPLSRTAAQAIGYAEAFAVLDGELAPERLAPSIATRTWRYAKRQRSWFRSDPRCVAVEPAVVAEAWAGPTGGGLRGEGPAGEGLPGADRSATGR